MSTATEDHRAARPVLPTPPQRPILVVDLGGQYARLIARRVRELGAWSELVPGSVGAAEAATRDPVGIILSGGPASVNDAGAPGIDPELLELGVPVLGICYGMQLLATLRGGRVAGTGGSEYGSTEVRVHNSGGALLGGVPDGRLDAWMSHRDTVTDLPEGFTATATSQLGTAAMESADRRLLGVQFHPEVVHTSRGLEILEAFVFGVAEARRDWTAGDVVAEQVDRIRRQVGDGRAICALSGGVDSTVAATLVHQAIGDRLTCVYVDHGLMRAGESDAVVTAMRDQLQVPIIHVDAAERFFGRLAGVDDPEEKRRIIGEEFIRVFEENASEVDGARFLVQGTLYSDVIESGGHGGGSADTIKSHHNVGGLPEEMRLELVEPLRLLFKDEVRRVGRELGIPSPLIERQPFPGPGLAIRIIGEVTPERVECVRHADAIVRAEVDAWDGDLSLWQAFAVLPNIRSVGVQGDGRSYAHPIVVRAVSSDDAMTADWARLPHDLVARISTRITNEVDGVNRVLLDITSKPPATIEWE